MQTCNFQMKFNFSTWNMKNHEIITLEKLSLPNFEVLFKFVEVEVFNVFNVNGFIVFLRL